MLHKMWRAWSVLGILILATIACNFNVNDTEISSATMARDRDGAQKTTTFASEDTFFVILDLQNAPNNTKIKTIWYAVDVHNMEPNSVIHEQEIETGSGNLYFSLSQTRNSDLWALGKYRTEIYLNGEKDSELNFNVEVQLADANLTAVSDSSRSSRFAPSDSLVATVNLKPAPENDQNLTVTWYNADEDIELSQETVTIGDQIALEFTYESGTLLPLGNYRVEISIGDKVVRTISFRTSVQLAQDAYLARDAEGIRVADDVFFDDRLFLIADISPSPENNSVIRVEWLGAGNPPELFGDTTVDAGTGGTVAIPQPEDLVFEDRAYLVRVYIDDQEIQTIRFSADEPLLQPSVIFGG